MFKLYSVYKEKLSKKITNGNEMFLYHGTSLENFGYISKNGFNRSLCGKNGNLMEISYLTKLDSL